MELESTNKNVPDIGGLPAILKNAIFEYLEPAYYRQFFEIQACHNKKKNPEKEYRLLSISSLKDLTATNLEKVVKKGIHSFEDTESILGDLCKDFCHVKPDVFKVIWNSIEKSDQTFDNFKKLLGPDNEKKIKEFKAIGDESFEAKANIFLTLPQKNRTIGILFGYFFDKDDFKKSGNLNLKALFFISLVYEERSKENLFRHFFEESVLKEHRPTFDLCKARIFVSLKLEEQEDYNAEMLKNLKIFFSNDSETRALDSITKYELMALFARFVNNAPLSFIKRDIVDKFFNTTNCKLKIYKSKSGDAYFYDFPSVLLNYFKPGELFGALPKLETRSYKCLSLATASNKTNRYLLSRFFSDEDISKFGLETDVKGNITLSDFMKKNCSKEISQLEFIEGGFNFLRCLESKMGLDVANQMGLNVANQFVRWFCTPEFIKSLPLEGEEVKERWQGISEEQKFSMLEHVFFPIVNENALCDVDNNYFELLIKCFFTEKQLKDVIIMNRIKFFNQCEFSNLTYDRFKSIFELIFTNSEIQSLKTKNRYIPVAESIQMLSNCPKSKLVYFTTEVLFTNDKLRIMGFYSKCSLLTKLRSLEWQYVFRIMFPSENDFNNLIKEINENANKKQMWRKLCKDLEKTENELRALIIEEKLNLSENKNKAEETGGEDDKSLLNKKRKNPDGNKNKKTNETNEHNVNKEDIEKNKKRKTK